MDVLGLCQVFESEPGEVHGLLGESLYLPCLTRNRHTFVEWRTVLGNVDGALIGDSLDGVFDYYRAHYTLEAGNTPRRDFAIQIKSVNRDEAQLRCEAIGEGGSGISATSVITVLGKY